MSHLSGFPVEITLPVRGVVVGTRCLERHHQVEPRADKGLPKMPITLLHNGICTYILYMF